MANLVRGSVEEQGPIHNCIAVTKHDTNPISATLGACRGVHVNVAGDIACRFDGATADVTLTLLAGVRYPYCLTYIRSAATTATGIHALY